RDWSSDVCSSDLASSPTSSANNPPNLLHLQVHRFPSLNRRFGEGLGEGRRAPPTLGSGQPHYPSHLATFPARSNTSTIKRPSTSSVKTHTDPSSCRASPCASTSPPASNTLTTTRATHTSSLADTSNRLPTLCTPWITGAW